MHYLQIKNITASKGVKASLHRLVLKKTQLYISKQTPLLVLKGIIKKFKKSFPSCQGWQLQKKGMKMKAF